MSDLLTPADVAAHLRCEIRKAYRLIGNEIPAAKVGGRWRVRRSDVDAYLDSITVTNRSTKARKRGRGRRVA